MTCPDDAEALCFRNAPLPGRGRDQHGARDGAYLAQFVPMFRKCGASAGVLAPILRFIDIGLLNLHHLPVGVQLVSDDHGQRGADTLAGLRILGHDGHDAIWRDADKGERRKTRLDLAGCFLR